MTLKATEILSGGIRVVINLETEMRDWIRGYRNNRLSVSSKSDHF
jgi:hypothetical protein